MNETDSLYISLNKQITQLSDEEGNLLEGTRITFDNYDNPIVLRFHNGYLDGDIFDNNGNLIKQKPAVEGKGHQEYWRHNTLHRDNEEPAIISNNFKTLEYWQNGIRTK